MARTKKSKPATNQIKPGDVVKILQGVHEGKFRTVKFVQLGGASVILYDAVSDPQQLKTLVIPVHHVERQFAANGDSFTSEQFRAASNAATLKASQLRELYIQTRDILGASHHIAAALFDEYMTADTLAHELRVKVGQIAMSEQMQYISAEEWASIVD